MQFDSYNLPGITKVFHGFARQPEDSAETSFMKVLILLVSLICCLCGVFWALIYFFTFGAGITALLPLSFVVLVGTAIVISHIRKNHHILIYTQIICITWITALIQWSIGSLDQSGIVIAWSFLGPVGAMIFIQDKRRAEFLLVLWIGILLVSAIFEPNFSGIEHDLPKLTRMLFYTMNLGASGTIVFLAVLFFYKQRERALEVMTQFRLLEKVNHEQELMLRQNEKLATLGKLSAGIAHELNNPASAVQRGTERMLQTIPQLKNAQYQLGSLQFSKDQQDSIAHFNKVYLDQENPQMELDPLDRNDREYELETALQDMRVENGWQIAPGLVAMGFEVKDLEGMDKDFSKDQLTVLFSVLCNVHTTNNLVAEIGQGASRISEIVKALKAYTYMDQAPQQFIDLQEGLDNTLVMLRSKLKEGISIHKSYEKNLPQVFGYGSELNQVWTNLIDNAVDAMDGNGDIYIHTWSNPDHIFVEIRDTGAGIPQDVIPNIFEPFFTTKEQGKGTGLGLHISYNIITKKHAGEITVDSKPGETKFLVQLPIKKGTENLTS